MVESGAEADFHEGMRIALSLFFVCIGLRW